MLPSVGRSAALGLILPLTLLYVDFWDIRRFNGRRMRMPDLAAAILNWASIVCSEAQRQRYRVINIDVHINVNCNASSTSMCRHLTLGLNADYRSTKHRTTSIITEKCEEYEVYIVAPTVMRTPYLLCHLQIFTFIAVLHKLKVHFDA